jgi:hypothetical protein
MPSSTSNSKRAGRSWRIGLVFCSAFLGLAVLGLEIGHRYPSSCWRGGLPPFSKEDEYIVSEAYTDRSNDLYSYYYDIGSVMAEVKKAEILIVGDSMPFFAFRNPTLLDFGKRTDLRIYSLAMEYGGGINLAGPLIRRHHLRPRLLIVSGNHFFSSGSNPYDRETVRMGAWRARSMVVQGDISWAFRRWMHPLFPRFSFGKMFGAAPVVLYRSRQNGCLSMENFVHSRVPVSEKSTAQEVLTEEEMSIAMDFKREMEAQGTQILLTSIPYGTDELDRLERWVPDPERRRLIANAVQPYQRIDRAAAQMGLPCLVPSVWGLFTFDGRHLDEESAEKFSTAFLKELMGSNHFKEKFGPRTR